VSITYQVIGLDEATELGIYDDVLDDWAPGSGIWRCEDGRPVELIGEDGGEPEDQVLYRAWAWVAPALKAAYELGRKHA
jgi:hypothetical protein